MSYRDDRMCQTQQDMLREKAALGILAAHLGKTYRHAEDPYSAADGVLYGGTWHFVEHKSRTKSYGDEWWMPVRKVEKLITLCENHEAIPILSVWYLDRPAPGEFYYRYIKHDDILRYGTGTMKPHLQPRAGVREDHSTEPACVYSLKEHFHRIF